MSAVVLSGGHIVGSGSQIFVTFPGGGGGGGGSGGGSNLVFSYANFTGAAVTTAFETGITGGQVTLPFFGTTHMAGGVWNTARVNISTFTTTFNFTINNGGFTASGSQYSSINGFTFCVQNSNSTTNPSGNYGTNCTAVANLCGYGVDGSAPFGTVPGNSVAIKFDSSGASEIPCEASTGGGPGLPSSVGLYINGGPTQGLVGANDLQPYGVNFYNNHSYTATVTYDGTFLTLVLLDTTSNAQARFSWAVNIVAACANSTTAWVGFTGGQVYTSAQISASAKQLLNSWSFHDGSVGTFTRLASPSFSPAGGAYGSTQTVTISGPSGASIYYTTNGLQPTSASTLYSSPITVSSSEYVQAVSIQSGFTDSYVNGANYLINNSGHTINYPSGFAAGNLILNGYSYLSSTTLVIVDGTGTGGPYGNAGFALGSAWYPAPVSVSTFTTNFTLQFGGAPGQTDAGMTFCLQNPSLPVSSPGAYLAVTGGPNYLGSPAAAFGYGPNTTAISDGTSTTGGILNSIAVSFAVQNNSVGLYSGGIPPNGADTTVTGVTYTSGHLLACTLTYNGTTLSLTIMDTTTLGSFSHSWTVNIPSAVGSTTAFAGFTASNGFGYTNQFVTNWTM
jgi:hypothetical protein